MIIIIITTKITNIYVNVKIFFLPLRTATMELLD